LVAAPYYPVNLGSAVGTRNVAKNILLALGERISMLVFKPDKATEQSVASPPFIVQADLMPA